MRRTPEQYSAIEFSLIRYAIKKDKARFLARIERNTVTSLPPKGVQGTCTVWTGALSRDGYGGMNVRILVGMDTDIYGKTGWREPGSSMPSFKLLVHRVALILQTGKPIPPEMESGHYGCFNRACIRHVKLESHAENCSVRDQRGLLKRLGYDVQEMAA